MLLPPREKLGNGTCGLRSKMVRFALGMLYFYVNEDPESYTTERPSETMACAPTEADFVVSDSKNPQREIRDGKLFADLRFRYAKQHVHPGRGWTRREPESRPTT